MTTKIDCSSSHLIDIISNEVLESMTIEETTDATLMMLPAADYRMLISCSELMSSVYKKLPTEHKNNFIIYPYPTALV